MIRFILSLALIATFAHGARSQQAAAPAAKLRELVTVTAELVRIGDLVENAGASANIAVFRAPDLGQTGAVQIARVTEALRQHDLANVDTGNLSEIIVTRLSRTITRQEIEERITRALAGQYGLGEARNLALTFDRDIRSVHLEATATAELAINRINVEPRTGRFDVVFDVPGSMAARRVTPLRYTGIASVMVETATATRAVARGEILKASDISIERRPKTEVAGDVLGAEQVVGMTSKRALRAGETVRSADLVKAEVVARNENVTIVVEMPGIMLTARGKALEAGAIGDLVSVLNIQSNRKIQATVTGPGRVTLVGATPFVAAATVPATNPERPSAE